MRKTQQELKKKRYMQLIEREPKLGAKVLALRFNVHIDTIFRWMRETNAYSGRL